MSVFAALATSFLLATPIHSASDPSKAESDKWQGGWRVVQMEITTGERTSRLKFTDKDDASVHVKDNCLEITGLMFPYLKGQLSFDPSRTPKRITIVLANDTKKGPTVEGTYTREDDGIELEIAKWPGEQNATVKLKLSLRRMKE